jgi:hypothetical protein
MFEPRRTSETRSSDWPRPRCLVEVTGSAKAGARDFMSARACSPSPNGPNRVPPSSAPIHGSDGSAPLHGMAQVVSGTTTPFS